MHNITICCLFYFLLLIQFTFGHDVHCVFIHGAGTIPDPLTSPTVHREIDHLPEGVNNYWGNVKLWTETTSDNDRPVCTSYAFTYLDTVHKPWDDVSLAEAACEALWQAKDENSFTQRIFLHSMGNLIFFNALYLNKCAINTGSVQNTNVYSFGGPMRGSEMVSAAKFICELNKMCKLGEESGLNNILDNVINIFSNPILCYAKDKFCDTIQSEKFQEAFGTICDRETGELTAAFASLARPPGEEILAIAKQYTKGAICGSEIEIENPLYKFVKCGDKIHGCATHDGVVQIESCMAVNPEAEWSASYPGDFWVAPFTHSQIIGRSGAKEVLKWLANRY